MTTLRETAAARISWRQTVGIPLNVLLFCC
jgi:hypothetical protein